MSYKRAVQILPEDLLEQIQRYIDGEFLYIPRKSNSRKRWGSGTCIRKELYQRDAKIFNDYLAGIPMQELSEKYFLSLKSIQRVIRVQKTTD